VFKAEWKWIHCKRTLGRVSLGFPLVKAVSCAHCNLRHEIIARLPAVVRYGSFNAKHCQNSGGGDRNDRFGCAFKTLITLTLRRDSLLFLV
jgi:hypothetical protein